jgi:pyruvyltransferase
MIDGLAVEIGCYWWNTRPNFGDALTSLILDTYCIKAYWAEPSEAQLVCIGSVMEKVSTEFSGTIIGTGFMSSGPKVRFSRAEILALRGPMSKYQASVEHNIVLGDIGLLVNRLVSPIKKKKWSIGIIPHYVDFFNPVVQEIISNNRSDICLIDATQDPIKVIKEISDCSLIISSSLHGLICADAFGIDSFWAIFSDKILGNGFKFFDHDLTMKITSCPVFLLGNEKTGQLTNLNGRRKAISKPVQFELDYILRLYASKLISKRIIQ